MCAAISFGMYASGQNVIAFLCTVVNPSIAVFLSKKKHYPLSHPEIENINRRNAHKPQNINQSANKVQCVGRVMAFV